MYNDDRVVAVVVAGGGGKRMGGKLPKQYAELAGRTVLEYTVEAFQKSAIVDDIIVVSDEGNLGRARELCGGFNKVRAAVSGGRERQDSVYNGISAYLKVIGAETHSIALVHDGARPFVTESLIERVAAGASELGACVPCVPIKDSIRRIESFEDAAKTLAEGGRVGSSRAVDRNEFYGVQTPQGFRLPLLLKAFETAREDGFCGTDEGSLVEHMGERVAVVMGDYDNIKLTTPEDMEAARCKAERDSGAGAEAAESMRIGTGYDVHRLVEGRKLVLCGVEIPYEPGLLGHSDADVATHALMDAMLGALALGDIGKLFPDSSDEFKGISSMKLLQRVKDRIGGLGYELGNADITIVAQKPKLSPYIADMRFKLAEVLDVPKERVSVKATTTEKLGFAGRGEGIEAQSVCLLKKKDR